MVEPHHKPLGPRMRAGQLLSGVVAGRDIIQIQHVAGDVVIRVDREAYRLESWPQPAAVSTIAAPSRLLAANGAVVPFDGHRRCSEMRTLARWRRRTDHAMAAMLVYGQGGQGKTRLATQFGLVSAQAGWVVTYARHGVAKGREHPRRPHDIDDGDGDTGAGTPSREPRGLLVLVDYAERWPADDLLTLMNDLRDVALPVRIVMLSRPAGDWWGRLNHELDARRIETEVLALGDLAGDSPTDRRAVFTAARDAFASALGVPHPHTIEPTVSLYGEGYRSVLSVHMAALVAVYAHRDGGASTEPNDTPAALAAYLLARERQHWHEAYTNRHIVSHPTVIARTTYVATLTGALAYGDAVRTLQVTGIASTPESAATVLTSHTACYPPTDPATVLEPLYPDRLGEDFLALQTPPRSAADGRYPAPGPWRSLGYEPDPWADTAASDLVTHAVDSGDLSDDHVRRAVTTLIETGQRWPHVARHPLYPLLRAHPRLALTTGSTGLSALARLDPDDDGEIIDVLHAVHQVYLAEPARPGLDYGIAEVVKRLSASAIAAADHPPEVLAQLHGYLGQCQRRAGLRSEAVVNTERAVELFEQLAAADPGYRPDLAAALDGYADDLAFGKQIPEALTHIERAVTIVEQLAADDPVYRPDLAHSLGQLARIRSRVPRRREALDAAERAVEILEQLVDHSATHTRDLAHAVNVLGLQLVGLGRIQEAYEVSRRESELRARLGIAPQEPPLSVYTAARMATIGEWIFDESDTDEYLVSTLESAVEFPRFMAEYDPGGWECGLANTLNGLARAHEQNGSTEEADIEEAVTALDEATQLYARLVVDNPDAFAQRLAHCLARLGIGLSDLGHHDGAIAATNRSLDCLLRFTEPDVVAVAVTLHNLGAQSAAAGHIEAAADIATKAAELTQQLAEANPERFDALRVGVSTSLESYRSTAGGPDDLARPEPATPDESPGASS